MLLTGAAEADRARAIPGHVIEALKSTGVIRMTVPRALGGLELDPLSQIEALEEIARFDPAVAWCAKIGSDTGYYLAFLDDLHAAALLGGDPNVITAGFTDPVGIAELVDGGFRVSGRWPFATACHHSQWLASGCTVYVGGQPRLDERGHPEWRIALLPTERCELHDTWDTIGVRASGSDDYTTEGTFVATAMTFRITDGSHRPEPLYAFPTMYRYNMAGVALGIGRGALDEFTRLALPANSDGGRRPLRDDVLVQRTFAEASARVASARAHIWVTMDELWAELQEGRPITADLHGRCRLALASTFVMVRDAVLLLYESAGARAIYRRNRLERLLRDAMTLSQHALAQDRAYVSVGRVLLGLDAEDRLF